MLELLKTNKDIWELFTKKEEYFPSSLDEHERFNYSLTKYKDIQQPIVSEFLIKNGLKIDFPDQKKFAVCLTHDIDNVSIHWKRKYIDSFKKISEGKIKSAYDRSFKKDLFLNFNSIMNLEEKYNAKSSFFILTAEKDVSTNGLYDAEKFKNHLLNVIERGWEIGLHGGYYSFNKIQNLKFEKEKLEKIIGKKVIGYRSHYLRFKVPDSWIILNQAGFKYDTTFGFPDMIGFRNGMCHPFNPYNLNTNTEIDILEVPLNIMDKTLFDYMNLNIKDSWELIKNLIDTVEKNNGVITILWHNTSMEDSKLQLYENILKYCKNKNAWMTSAEKIFNFIKSNY